MGNFSERLARILEEKHLTQKELSEMTQITAATISRYISGKRKPSAELLWVISNVLGVTADYLLGKTDNPTPPRSVEVPTLDAILATQGITNVENVKALKYLMETMAKNERSTELSKEFEGREYSRKRRA